MQLEIRDYVHAFQIYRNKHLSLKKREYAELYLINQFGKVLKYNKSWHEDDKEDEFMENYLVFKELIDSYDLNPKYLPYWIPRRIKFATINRKKYQMKCTQIEDNFVGRDNVENQVVNKIVEDTINSLYKDFTKGLSKTEKKVLAIQKKVKSKKLKDVCVGMSQTHFLNKRRILKEEFVRHVKKNGIEL